VRIVAFWLEAARLLRDLGGEPVVGVRDVLTDLIVRRICVAELGLDVGEEGGGAVAHGCRGAWHGARHAASVASVLTAKNGDPQDGYAPLSKRHGQLHSDGVGTRGS
jgi:hypothetical protein